MEMFPAYQTSIPDKKHLYNGIPVILGHGDNIPVVYALAGYLLFLGHLADTAKKLPVFNRFFKFHLFGSRRHPVFEVFHDRLISAAQKIQGLLHGLLIFLL